MVSVKILLLKLLHPMEKSSHTPIQIKEVLTSLTFLILLTLPLSLLWMSAVNQPAWRSVDGYAIAAVNTSSSFTNPSGKVVVIDMLDYKVVKEIALVGQPDAVSISPNGKFAAIAIENERDEDLNNGLIPQYPAGNVAIVNLRW